MDKGYSLLPEAVCFPLLEREVKLSQQQDVEAHGVVRRRRSHIF
jgi:hypothetical protein